MDLASPDEEYRRYSIRQTQRVIDITKAMKKYNPKEYDEFWAMADIQKVYIPEGVARNLSQDQYEKLYDATIIHEKPLTNALGENYRALLTKEKVIDLFKAM